MAANAPMLIKATMVDGKPEVGILPTGQVTGVIDELPTVAELLDRIVAEAERHPEAAGRRLMDLTWSAEEEAFRAEARAWLEAQPGRVAGRRLGRRAAVGRHPRGLRPAPRVGAAAVRRPVGGGVVAARARRPRRVAVGVAALRGGVLPGRRPAPGHAERHLPARPDDLRVRHARAAGRDPAAAWPRAEDLWCQGWSEPNAGSDLAVVTSRARRVDGGWVLDGQKTWTTRGAFCTHLFGLFRTDPDSERHKGLTYLLVPLDTPGVTVRGFGRLDGDEGFAEVFFDDAFLADDAVPGGVVLGEPEGGWAVAMATAGSERGLTLRSPGRFLATAERLARAGRASAATPTLRRRAATRVDARRGLPAADARDRHQAGRRREGRAPRPASPSCGGPSSTSSCTRSPSTCSAPRPSSTGRGARAGSSRCRARSTPAPTRSSATSPPSASWGSRDEVRADRRPGRVPRRGPRPAREGVHAGGRAGRVGRARRASSTAACGTASTPWACSALLVPEADGGLGLDETFLVPILEEAGRVALPHPLVETAMVAAPLARRAAAAWSPRDLGGPLVPCAADADALLAARQPRRLVLADRGDVDLDARRPPSTAAARAGRVAAGTAGGTRHRRARRRSSWPSTAARSARPRSSSASARRCSTSPSAT